MMKMFFTVQHTSFLLKKGAVSEQEFYSILKKNCAKKVPETCKVSKFPELFTGFILGKIYFETAPSHKMQKDECL